MIPLGLLSYVLFFHDHYYYSFSLITQFIVVAPPPPSIPTCPPPLPTPHHPIWILTPTSRSHLGCLPSSSRPPISTSQDPILTRDAHPETCVRWSMMKRLRRRSHCWGSGLRIRQSTSALAGDPDPYLRVFQIQNAIPGSVRVSPTGWLGAMSQKLVGSQVLVGPQVLGSTYKYSVY